MRKTLIPFLALTFLVFLVWLTIIRPLKQLAGNRETIVNSTVMLERVKDVFKMVDREIKVSEILDYRDFQYVDLPGFRKKAIVKVEAVAALGYDLQDLQIEVRDESRELVVKNWPGPEVLYVQSEYSYYDISEGIFNSFSERELNEIKIAADSLIRKKIQDYARSYHAGDSTVNEMLEILVVLCEAGGWDLVMDEAGISWENTSDK